MKSFAGAGTFALPFAVMNAGMFILTYNNEIISYICII